MNKKNGIRESKPKQSRRQGKSAPGLPIGRAYAAEPLTVGKVLTSLPNLPTCPLQIASLLHETKSIWFRLNLNKVWISFAVHSYL